MPDLGIDVLLKGQNFIRLLAGLGTALQISMISVAISVPFGIVPGVLMTWSNPFIKVILRICLKIVRIMPQMVLLFLVFFGTTRAFGWDLSGENASIIVFSFWGTAEMSDLVRGALISVPRHQYESGEALAMNRVQIYRYIYYSADSKKAGSAVNQSGDKNDQDDKSDIDGGSCRDFESRTTDHRSK